MSRISLTDTPVSAVMAISDGNPGAINVCMCLLLEGSAVDPDSALGGTGCLLSLDQHGIYGPRIWCLFKDVCGQSLVKTVACMRAVQLGQLSEEQLNHAIDARGDGVDADAVLAGVRARLPRFGATVPEVSP